MANEELALMAHLMRRAGFGATREELEARVQQGYENTVEELLNPATQQPGRPAGVPALPSRILEAGYLAGNGRRHLALRPH